VKEAEIWRAWGATASPKLLRRFSALGTRSGQGPFGDPGRGGVPQAIHITTDGGDVDLRLCHQDLED